MTSLEHTVYEAPSTTFGPAYEHALDAGRVAIQMVHIFRVMRDGQWRTLEDIQANTGYPTPSISAQLRHLRKARFGGHRVEKRRIAGHAGLWEYRLLEAA